MATMDYEACYSALELKFGAGLNEVNQSWRKLSRKHHPDVHARDPKEHRVALEKQKQINNARDILKKWFELNPHAMPPRSNTPVPPIRKASQPARNQQTRTPINLAQAVQKNDLVMNRIRTRTPLNITSNNGITRIPAGRRHPRKNRRNLRSGATGWFKASTVNLTPLQELVHPIDVHCAGESPSFIGMILCIAGAFGPVFVITSVRGTAFPELPGHYPDWMQALMLFGSGWCSWYIFRWFFSEAELIKLQQKELYFTSNRTLSATLELAKSTITKQSRPNAEWKFTTNGSVHEATIDFVEEVFPEVKRPRHLAIRLETRPGKHSVVLAMEVKAKSPINSFACKQMADALVTELRKELQPIAA